MKRQALRKLLVGVALLLGIGSAAIGAARSPSPDLALPTGELVGVPPFELAAILSSSPTDTVVISVGQARHPLDGALPCNSLGVSDEAVVARAPVSRRIILAGDDGVKTDRLARKLIATGHDVRVAKGGLEAWDRAMDSDPAAPAQGAPAQDWDNYRTRVALRRRFGVHDSTPAPAILARPVPPSENGSSAAPKKREGC